MNTNETTGTTETVATVKKWQADPANPPGPIQVKWFNDALNKVGREHNTRRELWGVVGGEEHDMCFFSVFGGGSRDDVTAVQAAIGERYGWTVTRANVGEITEAFIAALPELQKNRPVDDKRKTPEQDAEDKANIAKWDAERAEAARVKQAEQAKLANGGALGTVKRNYEHDGVEIAFTDKPDDNLRARLKAAGFRITRRPPWRWYQKYSAHAWARACELAGVKDEQPEDQAGAYVEAQEEAYFDRQAEAIGA